jgi:hypothetical protein
MSTKRELIMAALKTKLDTISGLPCFRSRVYPFKNNKIPAVVIEPVKEGADNSTISKLDWDLIFTATLFVKGETPDSVGDAYMSSIHSKIMEDRSLGDLCMDIVPYGTEYDFQNGDQVLGVITMSYRLTYRTNVNDLTA